MHIAIVYSVAGVSLRLADVPIYVFPSACANYMRLGRSMETNRVDAFSGQMTQMQANHDDAQHENCIISECIL